MTGILRLLRAPKPSIILAAEKDYKDIVFTRKTFQEARQAYQLLGVSEQMDMFAYNDGHAFSQPRRQAATGWMRRWLWNDPRPVAEPELQLQSHKTLNVTSEGSVLQEFEDARSLVDLNLEKAQQLSAARRVFWKAHSVAHCMNEIRNLLCICDSLGTLHLESHGVIRRESYCIEKLVIQRTDQPPVPALLWLPNDRETRRPAVVYADGRGKAVDGEPGGPIERLVAEGYIVMSIDIRGCGETADAGGKAPYSIGDHRIAMWSLHIGRPLLGQRVEDVLAARHLLAGRDDVAADRIELVGVERAGPVVLHAVALESDCAAKVTLRDSMRSWIDDVMAQPEQPDAIGHVVSGTLEHYDLPDLVRALRSQGVGCTYENSAN